MAPENDSDSKSIFDLTPEEASKRWQENLDKLKNKLFDMGLPITYQDERCPSEDYFIQEYEDGRVHLALLDSNENVFHFVKDLTHA